MTTQRPASPVVLITGATGVLGRAAAAAFAADGARLALAGRDEGRLRTMATELLLTDDRWVPLVADLRARDAARGVIADVEDRLGRVDILLHLVGGWTGGTALADLEPDVLEAMLDQHVRSTFHVAGAVVPGMVARGWGRIVAVTSSFTAAPTAGSAAYLTAKAGQEVMLRVLAREVAGAGLTVNLVAVKAIDTAHEREAAPGTRTASRTTPDEIVAAMRFLCSDAAAAVTGQRIALDGRA